MVPLAMQATWLGPVAGWYRPHAAHSKSGMCWKLSGTLHQHRWRRLTNDDMDEVAFVACEPEPAAFDVVAPKLELQRPTQRQSEAITNTHAKTLTLDRKAPSITPNPQSHPTKQ
jgi:hypothetical protein